MLPVVAEEPATAPLICLRRAMYTEKVRTQKEMSLEDAS